MTIRIEDLESMDFSDVVMPPMGISQYAVAKAIEVSPRRINEIVHGQRTITADTAVRLSRFFGLNDGFWLGLQADYDIAGIKKAQADF